MTLEERIEALEAERARACEEENKLWMRVLASETVVIMLNEQIEQIEQSQQKQVEVSQSLWNFMRGSDTRTRPPETTH